MIHRGGWKFRNPLLVSLLVGIGMLPAVALKPLLPSIRLFHQFQEFRAVASFGVSR